MKRVTFCEVKCLNCGKWFRSGIQFGDAETFFAVATTGNIQTCTFCGTPTPMNKENMRFGERREDGRTTYIEGKDTF